jgi:hypothetical protein
MRPMPMTARTLFFPLLALTFGLVLAAACGGDDGGERPTGRLTDPRSVPTATPWVEPPDPIILDPEALTPVPEENGGEDQEEGTDSNEVTSVTPFQITSDESTNVRASPSTEGAILGTITAGEENTVTGQVSGEAVEDGNDIWYQLDDGSFVYSGAVKKVEE